MRIGQVLAVVAGLAALSPAMADSSGYKSIYSDPGFNDARRMRQEEQRRYQEAERERQRMIREQERAQQRYYNNASPYGNRRRY